MLAEKYPKVNIVMIHMGHGRGVYIQEKIETEMKYPNLYLGTFCMLMHIEFKEAYEKVDQIDDFQLRPKGFAFEIG